MLYINTSYNLFSSSNIGRCAPEYSYLSGGNGSTTQEGNIGIQSNATKYYLRIDVQTTNALSDRNVVTLRFSDNTTSSIELYNGRLYIEVNGVSKAGTSAASSVWHNVLAVYDTEIGRIDYYLGSLNNNVCSYESFIKNKATLNRLSVRVSNEFYVKNIILSESPIDFRSKIKLLPLTYDSGDWTKNDDEYTAEEPEKSMVFKANMSSISTDIITGGMMAVLSAQKNENVNAVEVDIGGTKLNMELPYSGAILTEFPGDLDYSTVKITSKG